jgi:hypothetical protein
MICISGQLIGQQLPHFNPVLCSLFARLCCTKGCLKTGSPCAWAWLEWNPTCNKMFSIIMTKYFLSWQMEDSSAYGWIIILLMKKVDLVFLLCKNPFGGWTDPPWSHPGNLGLPCPEGGRAGRRVGFLSSYSRDSGYIEWTRMMIFYVHTKSHISKKS